MNLTLTHAESDTELMLCFPLMQQLRPHLADAKQFVLKMRRQQLQGYRVLALWQADKQSNQPRNTPIGLAGYRLQENTIYGKFIYIDDLVVGKENRSTGLGEQLLTAVRARAMELGCNRLVLDTGLANSLAQRFYFRQGMLAGGLHFTEALSTPQKKP